MRPRALLVLAVVALALVAAAASWACGPNRAIELDSFSYPPRATVYVNGANFEPGATVSIKVDGATVRTTTVSGNGTISTSFTAPSAPGTYVVTTDGVDQNGQPSAGAGNAVTFRVVSSGSSGGGRPPSYGAPGAITPMLAPMTLPGCPSGRRLLSLTSANDDRAGTPGNDLIFAGAGNDAIDARAGDDCVDLGLGRDRGQGATGEDLVLGGDGVDRVLGGSGNDALHGQGGNDRVSGGRGSDRVAGGGGRDALGGGSGKDRLGGGAGSDRIAAGSGNDVLKGNSGNDRLSGGSGRDRISCGRGTDTAITDKRDVVAGDCERVRRRRG